jgi:hypothetical protein
MTLKCVWEGRKSPHEACSYIARVRIKVRAGESVICREGCGSGHGSGPARGEAHESAIKEAETDTYRQPRKFATLGRSSSRPCGVSSSYTNDKTSKCPTSPAKTTSRQLPTNHDKSPTSLRSTCEPRAPISRSAVSAEVLPRGRGAP